MTPKRIDPTLRKHLSKALPVAVQAAREAGEFISKKFGRFRSLSTKPDAGLVTEVDHGSEKIVLRALQKKFPNDRFWGEESGFSAIKDTSPFCWHIDPLDGTTNFVHKFPFFCVSIGLEFENQDLVLGVVYQPMSKDLYHAFSGGGAFANKKRIRVSQTAAVANALLSTGFSYKKSGFLEQEIASLRGVMGASQGVRRTGSAALDLTFVSTGQFDGFWERGLASWDVAGGLALLCEAGGHYTKLDGEPYRVGDPSLLATNGRVHEELFTLLQGKSA
jgi:myo-inositol-1(or 4)-monophosphatase